MKPISALLFGMLLITTYNASAQKNLLNTTENEIKYELPKDGASLKDATYTDNGTRILMFDYALENNLLLSAFYIDDSGLCRCCVYTYKENSNLNNLVKSINLDTRFERVPDKFEWVNNNRTIDIKIVMEHDENNGYPNAFSVVYNRKKP